MEILMSIRGLIRKIITWAEILAMPSIYFLRSFEKNWKTKEK
jgi:hypothetical protein